MTSNPHVLSGHALTSGMLRAPRQVKAAICAKSLNMDSPIPLESYVSHNVCNQCGSPYDLDKTICPVCKELSDNEVIILKKELEELRLKTHASMGKKLYIFAFVLVIITIIFVILWW